MSTLNNNLETLLCKMEDFVTTKTVVGEPVNVGDTIIIPLVDVAFGVGAGAKDDSEDKKVKETSAGGLGARITPSAVVVIQGGSVQMINVKNQNSLNKLIDMVPGIVSNFNLDSLFKKNKDKKTVDDIKLEEERIVE